MKKIVSKITELYALLLMVVFPLFMTDKYYNIQEAKLYFYLYTTTGAVALVVLCVLFGKLMKLPWDPEDSVSHTARSASKQSGSKPSRSAPSGSKSTDASGFFRKCLGFLRPTDAFALLFFFVLILSTIGSEWTYEAFWGNMGRHQGCFLWLWYLCTYVLLSRFYEARQWHMDLFLLAALVVCVWGVLDAFWMSPIHWQIDHAAGKETAFDFSSTIGNVNILTGLEGMYLAAASAMFIGGAAAQQKNTQLKSTTDSRKKSAGGNSVKQVPDSGKEGFIRSPWNSFRPVYYFICACAAFMALVCGCSDNALLSVGAVICFLPFYAFGTKKGLIRYTALLAGYLFTMALTGFFARRDGQQMIPRKKWGELLKFSVAHPSSALAGCVILALVAALLYWVLIRIPRSMANDQKRQSGTDHPAATDSDIRFGRRLRRIWLALGILASAALIFVFYDANAGGHPELYAPYRKLLIFSDSWGTHRGYNWQLAMKYFRDFPVIKKLFGSGPETYGIFTHVYDHYQMLDMFNETYDSPHNEWLQYLFTTGILGFIAYYGMIISSITAGFCLQGRSVLHMQSQKNPDIAPVDPSPASASGPRIPAQKQCISAHRPEPAPAPVRAIGAAFAYGIFVYTIQSFVNISVPITVPYVILGMGICNSLHHIR